MPGGPFSSSLAAMNQAQTTTKQGLRNSDGCTLPKPMEYQRTAPLPKSVPKNGRKTSETSVRAKPISASRRTSTGAIIDVATSTISARTPKAACRST